MDQATHYQIKTGANYVSPKEQNMIIWLPIYSPNPILQTAFEICAEYFQKNPKLLQPWSEVDKRTQTGNKAGLGGQPSPRWGVGPAAHLWPTKKMVTHDVTAFFQPLEPQEYESSQQKRLHDHQGELSSRKLQELTGLHKIRSSQRILAKGVSIFLRARRTQFFMSSQIRSMVGTLGAQGK